MTAQCLFNTFIKFKKEWLIVNWDWKLIPQWQILHASEREQIHNKYKSNVEMRVEWVNNLVECLSIGGLRLLSALGSGCCLFDTFPFLFSILFFEVYAIDKNACFFLYKSIIKSWTTTTSTAILTYLTTYNTETTAMQASITIDWYGKKIKKNIMIQSHCHYRVIHFYQFCIKFKYFDFY